MLFTDTDSLTYQIKSEDIHEDSSQDNEMIGFNYYATKSKCYNDSKKLVVGKMSHKMFCWIRNLWGIWWK